MMPRMLPKMSTREAVMNPASPRFASSSYSFAPIAVTFSSADATSSTSSIQPHFPDRLQHLSVRTCYQRYQVRAGSRQGGTQYMRGSRSWGVQSKARCPTDQCTTSLRLSRLQLKLTVASPLVYVYHQSLSSVYI